MGEAAGAGGAVPDIQGNDLEQFGNTKTEVILEPEEFRTGEVVEPYSSVKK